MTIDLYMSPASPPCRAVLMVAKELNVTLNNINLDLRNGEHKKPEFLKINPQHSIPTIVDHDNGLALWESRAIMQYMMNKYAPKHKLYPSDVKERAIVDRCLYFEAGSLFPAQASTFYPVFRGGQVDMERKKVYEEKLEILDKTLEGKKYLAGHDHYTIADLSLITTLTAAECFPGVDLSKYANIHKWYKNLRAELPYDKELNEQPVQMMKGFVDGILNKK